MHLAALLVAHRLCRHHRQRQPLPSGTSAGNARLSVAADDLPAAVRCWTGGWPGPRRPSRAYYLGWNAIVVTFLSLSPPSPTPEPVNLASASMLPLNPCPVNWIAATVLPDSVITELPEIV
jgi:hypothetical protein